MTLNICIVINGRPSDVIPVKVDSHGIIASEKVNDVVLAFIKAEVCDVAVYRKVNNHSFIVTSTKGTDWTIDWKKVDIWTEEELKSII